MVVMDIQLIQAMVQPIALVDSVDMAITGKQMTWISWQ